MQLRKVAKIRRFTIIARRSIANIANVPGRVGRSLDDECLDIAIIRRGKYASLLNLDGLSEELSSRAKSLTTLVTDDTNGTNDYNSDVNDLSVAEKSMRMLNVTAEDVMDARARIQERSYWEEQEAIEESPEVIEEVVKQFPLEKDKEEMIDATRNKQSVKDDLEKTVNRTLRKEDIMEYPSIKEEGEKNHEKIIPIDKKEEVLIGSKEDVSVKSEDVTSDKVAQMKSYNVYVAPKKKRKERQGVAKIVQCPSFQSAKDMETKPCASFVRKLEAKLCPVPINQQDKWIDRVDRKRHSCQVNMHLTPTDSSGSKKERYKKSKIPCACRRALRNSSKNGKHVQSIDFDGKNVEYNINGKEFRSFTPIVNMQRSKVDKSAFKYSEAYRLKKQIQKWEESHGKQSWGSKSLAQTARSSGYAKNVVDASDKLSIVHCRKSVQTETCDGSMMMSDSLSERYRLKHGQMQSRRTDLRSVYNAASFKEKNYAEAHETKMKTLETYNNPMLENKRETKARKRHDLLPMNHKLSIEQREAIELRALKAYNDLTLLEDKRELEVRKERDSLLNYGQLTKESEMPEMKVLRTYNDPTLPEDKKEVERTREHNLSQQSVDERSISRVHNELARSEGKRELQTERKCDSRDETPSECEEDIEIPASVSNCLSIGSCEGTTIPIRRNSNSDLNNRYARQAHMSLNLREITRNIEWTIHPRGIILTNKNLHSQFLENGRFRESQQRDIVDDNTASMLHSAFFFKPEIITRVFQRAHNQTRIDEFFSSISTFRRENFNTEFVCRVNNEIDVRNRDSFDCDFERMMGNDRNLGDSVLSNANDNHGIRGEHGLDLFIIFIDREEIPSESQTAIEDSTTVGSQEDARSNIESTQMTNILIFDDNHNRVDNAINDNLPIRLVADVLRNFDIEMSEGSIRDVALPIEDVSNVNIHNNLQSQEFNADNVNLDEENNNECDRTSLHKNADIDDTIHEVEQTLNSSDNCLDNVNVTSYVNSLEQLDNLRNKKYLSTAENNLSPKNTDNNTMSQLSDNNNNNKQFDMLDNKTEKNMFDRVFKNSSKLSFPGPSSLNKSDNYQALRSCDEEFQKLTQLSDSAATLNNQRKESLLNLKVTNYDTISQCQSVETLKLKTVIQEASARSQNENKDEEENKFLAEKIFKMHSDDKLQQDDSFYLTYERNDDPGTPVSLEDGSLMEEFLNDPVPLNSSYS